MTILIPLSGSYLPLRRLWQTDSTSGPHTGGVGDDEGTQDSWTHPKEEACQLPKTGGHSQDLVRYTVCLMVNVRLTS